MAVGLPMQAERRGSMTVSCRRPPEYSRMLKCAHLVDLTETDCRRTTVVYVASKEFSRVVKFNKHVTSSNTIAAKLE